MRNVKQSKQIIYENEKMKKFREGDGDVPKGACFEFVLLPNQRQQPQDSQDYEGFYRGNVRIVLCNLDRSLDGRTVTLRTKALPNCVPYFVYWTKDAILNGDDLNVMPHRDCARPRIRVARLKDTLDATDFAYLMQEDLRGHFPFELRQLAAELVPRVPKQFSFANQPFYNDDTNNLVASRSHMKRQSILIQLCEAFMKSSLDHTQREKLTALAASVQRDLFYALCTHPWELCYHIVLRVQHGCKLNPLREPAYWITRRERKIPDPGAPHISYALSIYFRLCEARESPHCHTCLPLWSFQNIVPAGPDREQIRESLWQYGEEHGLLRVANQVVATSIDVYDGRLVCDAFRRIRENALRDGEPTLRGVVVPHVYGSLTKDQERIADYIISHWITVVRGMPGTGKTRIVEWVFSHYRNVMLCGFVGMMVKMLRRRNGNRDEVAHTIHHLLALRKHCAEPAMQWLDQYEVLVIDEAFNVSNHLMSKLLALFKNVRKVIFVGDGNQLEPIECGNPMQDIEQMVTPHLLTENLRVDPRFKSLQEAPRLILEGRSRDIVFRHGSCISFVPKRSMGVVKDEEHDDTNSEAYIDMAYEALLPICKQALQLGLTSLMDFHVITLTNYGPEGRYHVNRAVERAWKTLGRLTPTARGGAEIRRGVHAYRGCKLMITQNYNYPVKHGERVVSEPVHNGELLIVKDVAYFRDGGGGYLLTVSEDDNVDDKVIWVGAKGGIDAKHVDLGYASTAYKSQGREFQFVVFMVPTRPGPQWTRPNAYVAISRGRERVWVVGSDVNDFHTICNQLPHRRDTVLSVMLRHEFPQSSFFNDPVPYESERIACDDLILDEDKSVPCVPVIKNSNE